MPSGRAALSSLVVGLLHAAGLLLVARHLGYAIGPSAYSVVGASWRYGGLVVAAAVPTWLAIRHRLLAPSVALLLTTGYVLGLELTPPGPTFRDVAELERLSEPTGLTVVDHGLYIVRYMLDATLWTVGYLLLGLVEHAVRTDWERLPSPPTSPWLPIPASRRQATGVAAVGGVGHAAVTTGVALRLGLSGGDGWLRYAVGVVGMWLLAAVPLYLLVRRRLVLPTALLTAFVLFDARAGLTASVDEPHALYFGGWFLFLGVALLGAGLESGCRRLGDVRAS